ncbi:MAG: iron export ABC transporter permease subunit FetB [Candidatus Cloacimonetes bacterium]|nr:iron export ABC transporter permease subunit FetB [Candidatus Cloacimonadota bacterium]
MENDYIHITNWGLFGSIGFMLLVALVAFLAKLGITKSIFIGTIRSFLQLILMGYVLSFIFKANEWYYTVLIVLIMYVFAAWDSFKGIKFRPKNIFTNSFLAMFLGSIFPLIYMFYALMTVKPWFNPQYIIPISAMVISNTMSGISICLNHFGSNIKLRKLEVEAKLSLGANINQATEEIQKSSIKAGLIPTVNALMVLGIVKLPGMMTGQIIGGVDPVESVKYQLLIMYIISASTAVSLYILVKLIKSSIFNKRGQLL